MGQERLSFLLTDLMDLVHDQGDQLGIVSGIVNHGAGIDRQALTALTLALAQGGASDGVELADQLVKDSEEEILLGVKIVIDGTLAELGVACDLLQGGLVIALAEEKLTGSGENILLSRQSFSLLAA